MYSMRTCTAYTMTQPPARQAPRDSAMRAIRAALISRGTSFRTWVRAWAVANGRDPAATYETARATIARRLQRGLAPQGEVGIAIVEALRAELGAVVVPYPIDPTVTWRGPSRRRTGTEQDLTGGQPVTPGGHP